MSSAPAGAFTVWADGVKARGATSIKTSPSSGATINHVVVGMDGADNTAGLTVNVDDVVISKSYIGP